METPPLHRAKPGGIALVPPGQDGHGITFANVLQPYWYPGDS